MLSNEEKCPLLALVTSLSSLVAEFESEQLHAVKAHREAALCRRVRRGVLFILWIKMCYIGIGIVIRI